MLIPSLLISVLCGIFIILLMTSIWYKSYFKKTINKNNSYSAPTYDNSAYPTFTFSTRSRNILKPLLDHINCKSKNNNKYYKICIFGPGCIKEKNFCPEFMEIVAILWRFHIQFTIIDKDVNTLNALKNNNIYYLPHDYKKYIQADSAINNGNDSNDELKRYLLKRILNVTKKCIGQNDQRMFVFDNNKHEVNTIKCDFIELFEKNKLSCQILFDVIIANNCLFFAFNDNRLKEDEEKWKYLLQILSKLNKKNKGIMFIDSASLKMIENVETRLLDIGYTANHLGWRNYVIHQL